jgi:hypothetical protein
MLCFVLEQMVFTPMPLLNLLGALGQVWLGGFTSEPDPQLQIRCQPKKPNLAQGTNKPSIEIGVNPKCSMRKHSLTRNIPTSDVMHGVQSALASRTRLLGIPSLKSKYAPEPSGLVNGKPCCVGVWVCVGVCGCVRIAKGGVVPKTNGFRPNWEMASRYSRN